MCSLALVLSRSIFFFFFQAEDGIRDLTVTGVQTCALPISRAGAHAAALAPRLRRAHALLQDGRRLRRVPQRPPVALPDGRRPGERALDPTPRRAVRADGPGRAAPRPGAGRRADAPRAGRRGRRLAARVATALEWLATLSAGLFAGAALYVSLLEHPARGGLGPRAALDQL